MAKQEFAGLAKKLVLHQAGQPGILHQGKSVMLLLSWRPVKGHITAGIQIHNLFIMRRLLNHCATTIHLKDQIAIITHLRCFKLATVEHFKAVAFEHANI